MHERFIHTQDHAERNSPSDAMEESRSTQAEEHAQQVAAMLEQQSDDQMWAQYTQMQLPPGVQRRDKSESKAVRADVIDMVTASMKQNQDAIDLPQYAHALGIDVKPLMEMYVDAHYPQSHLAGLTTFSVLLRSLRLQVSYSIKIP